MDSTIASTPQRDPPQQSSGENNDVTMESEEPETTTSNQSQASASQTNSQSQEPSQEGNGLPQNGATPEQPRMV